jgi:hypothetical protein
MLSNVDIGKTRLWVSKMQISRNGGGPPASVTEIVAEMNGIAQRFVLMAPCQDTCVDLAHPI